MDIKCVRRLIMIERRSFKVMLEWSTPSISDGDWIRKIIAESGNMGSDVSFANMYLLREKYDIQICSYRGFLLRHYNGYYGRKGYTFPIGTGSLEKALQALKEDAKKRREPLYFCLLTEELANLAGKAFHKKKNHFSKFVRTYPEYRFEQIGAANWQDAVLVEDMWYYEHLQEEDESQKKEYAAVKEALEHFEQLELLGGLLYVNDTPAAMTVASYINEDTCDIHFEKAVGECVTNGAYAAINRLFAQTLNCTWLNREEDIGIEGLRKAKMSYHPKMLVKKYNAHLK